MTCWCALRCNTPIRHACSAGLALSSNCSVWNTILVCSVSISIPCLASLFVWTRSKSLTDIPMVYPVRKAPDGNVIHDGPGGQWNQEDKRKCSVAPKDGEEKWQDVSPEVLPQEDADKTVGFSVRLVAARAICSRALHALQQMTRSVVKKLQMFNFCFFWLLFGLLYQVYVKVGNCKFFFLFSLPQYFKVGCWWNEILMMTLYCCKYVAFQ